jgi:putative transposase
MNFSAHSPGHRALRKGRVSLPGQHYLITTACENRERRFAESATAVAVSSKLCENDLWADSYLLCWALMPDHLHLLIALGAQHTLSELIRRIKCVTSKAANTADGRSGRTWACGFHDRALRETDDVIASARYIVANPIRAGLVADIADYPYWGAIWGREKGLLF